jgi:hypothetical protein
MAIEKDHSAYRNLLKVLQPHQGLEDCKPVYQIIRVDFLFYCCNSFKYTYNYFLNIINFWSILNSKFRGS